MRKMREPLIVAWRNIFFTGA